MAISGLIFASHVAIADQLNTWQVLPRPERFSELYFTDYHQLPASLYVGSTQRVRFTVHNLEHRTTTYQYTIVAFAPDRLAQQQLASGSLTLGQNESQVITQALTTPALSQRIMIQVSLQYSGILPGGVQPSTETQSIHYWLKVPNAPKGAK
ncbi:MAG TPA: DUF1616 domain-containing protein [Candidatus Acidoferrum sp.]|nr:DUF1616 domain-containing protein [Candidatus Acidoferrum sp.]